MGPIGAELSHSEGDEAVVSLDVPLEDLRARSQHTLEAGPVQLHALEWSASDYGGRPGAIQQQGDFTWKQRKTGYSAGTSGPKHAFLSLFWCNAKVV